MSFENPIRYHSPEDSDDVELFRHHRFEITDGDEVVAAAEVHYHSKPLPFYQISDLYTETAHQGQGYGSAIMDQVEAFLIERKKPGILADTSIYTHPSGKSFYQSRGWVPIDATGNLIFNPPAELDTDLLQRYAERGAELSTDTEKSESNRKKFLTDS